MSVRVERVNETPIPPPPVAKEYVIRLSPIDAAILMERAQEFSSHSVILTELADALQRAGVK